MASSRKLLHLFCKVLGLFICVSVRTALADVSIESGLLRYKINVFGTISRDDATKLAQREAEAELEFGFNPELFLNSTGGDVDAAMSIGRIVRRIDGFTQVKRNAQCYSSCALIYIAGPIRHRLDRTASALFRVFSSSTGGDRARRAADAAAFEALYRRNGAVRQFLQSDGNHRAIKHGSVWRHALPETAYLHCKRLQGYLSTRATERPNF